jgi:hypothetical protein
MIGKPTPEQGVPAAELQVCTFIETVIVLPATWTSHGSMVSLQDRDPVLSPTWIVIGWFAVAVAGTHARSPDCAVWLHVDASPDVPLDPLEPLVPPELVPGVPLVVPAGMVKFSLLNAGPPVQAMTATGPKRAAAAV